MSATEDIWRRIREIWSKRAAQLTYVYLPDPDAPPPVPQDSYLRLWLADMFLAESRKQAADVYPSLRACVRLSFGTGDRVTLATVVVGGQGATAGPGTHSGRLTGLIPFAGGTVAVQAGLYRLRANDRLRLAFEILASFSSLLVPPLASIAALSEKVAGGIDKVELAVERAGDGPVLVLDREYAVGGPPGDALVGGHVVVVSADAGRFDPARLAVLGGRLCYDTVPVEGHDYLVLRVETRTERDDWLFPEWNRLIASALEARVRGEQSRFARYRTEVLAQIALSADLTANDRRRAAKLVKDELDRGGFEAASDEGFTTLDDLIAQRGLPPASTVDGLTLAELLQ